MGQHKLNTWYKRTDVDFSKPKDYTLYSTHFYIVKECNKTYRCSKVIQGCNDIPRFIDQKFLDKQCGLIECSQEEIDLLLKTNNYEIY